MRSEATGERSGRDKPLNGYPQGAVFEPCPKSSVATGISCLGIYIYAVWRTLPPAFRFGKEAAMRLTREPAAIPPGEVLGSP